MILEKEERIDRKLVIDLSGPDGNAFVIMGYANKFAKQLSYSKDKIEELMADMQSSDYDHLIQVFDDHFGLVVDLQK